MAPPAPAPSIAPAPPLPPVQQIPNTPPPQLTQGQGAEDTAVVKRRKSKRKELQQASRGTDALRIDLSKAIGGPSGSTGSTGINIPK